MEKEAKVEKLVELIAYGEGSVVSKTLMKKPSGSVTLFSLDRGQGLDEHSAPYDAMVFVLDGSAEITLDGESKVVEQGEMLIMPANVPHAVKAVQSFKMLLTMLRDGND